MEWGVWACLRENKKYSNAIYATKTRRLENSKYNRNSDVNDRIAHSRRHCPRRYWSPHEHQKTSSPTDLNHWRQWVHPGRSQAGNWKFQSKESTKTRRSHKWNIKTRFQKHSQKFKKCDQCYERSQTLSFQCFSCDLHVVFWCSNLGCYILHWFSSAILLLQSVSAFL